MTLPADYVHQRYADPDMKVRDIGRALAEVLWMTYAPKTSKALALDSETVTDNLGRLLLAELTRSGYAVTFTGRRIGHL